MAVLRSSCLPYENNWIFTGSGNKWPIKVPQNFWEVDEYKGRPLSEEERRSTIFLLKITKNVTKSRQYLLQWLKKK